MLISNSNYNCKYFTLWIKYTLLYKKSIGLKIIFKVVDLLICKVLKTPTFKPKNSQKVNPDFFCQKVHFDYFWKKLLSFCIITSFFLKNSKNYLLYLYYQKHSSLVPEPPYNTKGIVITLWIFSSRLKTNFDGPILNPYQNNII